MAYRRIFVVGQLHFVLAATAKLAEKTSQPTSSSPLLLQQEKGRWVRKVTQGLLTVPIELSGKQVRLQAWYGTQAAEKTFPWKQAGGSWELLKAAWGVRGEVPRS